MTFCDCYALYEMIRGGIEMVLCMDLRRSELAGERLSCLSLAS